jgi:hypothetical protein
VFIFRDAGMKIRVLCWTADEDWKGDEHAYKHSTGAAKTIRG